MSDFIKDYWNRQAAKHKSNHSASWGDNYAIELEIESISKYLTPGTKVLDVGCANGFSTFRQLQTGVKHITGVDFSETMIKYAKERKENEQIQNVDFLIGDIRKLPFANDTFDCTYTTRVLINLPNWDDQILGIEECLRVTKTNGIVVFSEAFYEPLVLLNSLRTLRNLEPLVEHDFNRYLKISKLEELLNKKNLKFMKDDFSSVYYLGSRFLRELISKIEDYPGYSNPINKIFYELEKSYSGGGFGIQMIYVIEKSNDTF
jgi:ubiquinone/menaquinone biosynthesis C-methylase UbiE